MKATEAHNPNAAPENIDDLIAALRDAAMRPGESAIDWTGKNGLFWRAAKAIEGLGFGARADGAEAEHRIAAAQASAYRKLITECADDLLACINESDPPNPGLLKVIDRLRMWSIGKVRIDISPSGGNSK